ncbi:MAG: Asp-tRNA(Asn)/Glu-tRNA(Gln) amidotransferase subunit GatC [Gammaproteobacteria bacterium]|nr:Asp-tRNA(Asn)/Glu-tRNA(Gln) amidotransferase subunit GatC [Gammaproteobacteria bacterium]
MKKRGGLGTMIDQLKRRESAMDVQTVKKMAALARIRIQDEEMPYYQAALAKMVGLSDHLLSVDSEGVEPMYRPHDGVQFLREDCVTEVDRRDVYLDLAPACIAGLYLVPKVIE